jgi:hypothetical protein
MPTDNSFILDQLRKAREPKPKKERKPIAKVSKKRAKQIADEKELRGDNDTLKENWFKARRKNLVGVCQCGCARPSQKKDDMYFRHSICHIFPKGKFESVMYHPLNYVERAFFGGCHSIMDDTSMDRWVGMADFDDIKVKFYELAPLLTEEERATKFYSHLERLVYEK